MLVPASVLKAAATMAYPTPDRFQLCGVHLRREGLQPVAEATDGKTLIQCRWKEDPAADYPATDINPEPVEDWTGAIIPTRDSVTLAKGAPRKPLKPILGNVALEESSANGTIKAVTTDLESTNRSTVKTIEGRFPNCDVAVPKSKPVLTMKFHPGYLLQAIKALADSVGFGRYDQAVTLEIHKPDRPIIFRATGPDGIEALVGIMPIVTTK